MTVIGVTPPGFFGLNVGRSFDVVVPLGVEPLVRSAAQSRLDRRTSWWLAMMVRLKPGQSLADGLYGLEPGDPATLVAAAATLALIGAVAGWLPANRASRLDPAQVLHDI